MSKSAIILMLVAIFSVVHATPNGNDDLSSDEVSSDQNTSNSLDWLTNTRNEWSRVIGNTGQRLDGFFADSDAIEKTNGSFVKLAARVRFEKEGEADFEPLAKFRLDLPTLKEKLRFTIESDPIENRSLEEKSRENTLDNESATTVENSTVASLKYQFESIKNKFDADRWKASSSLGAEIELPVNTFWRNKLRYTLELDEAWKMAATQKLYYFHKDGWGESTNLEFQYTCDEFVFRSISEAKYIHEDRQMEFAKRFYILKELTHTRAINFQIGILGTNTPSPIVTDYFTNIVYRRMLLDDWLFYEMTPELLFPRDDSFKASPSFTAKLEIVFSSK